MNLEELKANIVRDCFTLYQWKGCKSEDYESIEQIFKLLNEILERK